MLNLSGDMLPDLELYKDNLSADKTVYFDQIKSLHMLKYDKQVLATLEAGLLDYIRTKSGNRIMTLKRDDIIDFLIKYERVPEGRMLVRDSKGTRISLDRKKVINPLEEAGYAPGFMYWYIPYVEYKSATQNFESFINRASRSAHLSAEGFPLVECSYFLSIASTGRLYYKDENIQAIPKRYLSAMTVPADYFLVWGDFAQIDLRVAFHLYLRGNPKYDEIFRKYDDKYEAVARIIHLVLGQEFNPEQFKKDRNSYKVSVLSRLYDASIDTMLRSNPNVEFVKFLDRFFKEHQYYQKAVRDLKEIIENGVQLEMRDYFGYENTIAIENQDENFKEAINFPVQSTSNSIVVHLVNSIVRRFREAGFNEDKFRVYLIRHDEPIFMVHKDCAHYLHILKDYSKVQVDDWDELLVDPYFGFSYGEVDNDLMMLYEQVSDIYKGQMTPRKIGEKRKYKPAKSVFNFSVEYTDLNGRLLVTALYKNWVVNFEVDTPEQIIDWMVDFAKDKDCVQLNLNGYLPKVVDYRKGLFIQTKDVENTPRVKARILMRYRKNQILEEAGFYDDMEELSPSDVEYCMSVKEVAV